MLYLVYKITNLVNNKIYIGFHGTNNIDDGYMGSGKLIKKAITKYGVESFSKEVLKIFDNKKEAEDFERLLVNKEFVEREDTYNMSIGGNVCILYGNKNGFYGKQHTEEFRKFISEFNKGNKFAKTNQIQFDDLTFRTYKDFATYIGITKNIRQNVIRYCGNPNNTARFIDNEFQKFSEYYFIKSEEKNNLKRQLMAKYAKDRFTGIKLTTEHKEKISSSKIGKPVPHLQVVNRDPEKIRKTTLKHLGSKRTDDAKRKMSEAKKGKPASNKGKFLIEKDGVRKQHDKNLPVPDGWTKVEYMRIVNQETGKWKIVPKTTILEEGWKCNS